IGKMLKIGYPSGVIDNTITLDSLKENRHVPVFVLQVEIQSVAEIRMRATYKGPVIGCNYTITIYISEFKHSRHAVPIGTVDIRNVLRPVIHFILHIKNSVHHKFVE